ncbi:MAG: hypothetical protein ABEI52_06605 [Halobacteriaceae archaeon]
MSGYNKIDSRGSYAHSYPLYIYSYPNTNGVYGDEANAVYNGVGHALDQLYDMGAIDFYEIQEYDTPLYLNDPDEGTYWDNLNIWLGDRNKWDYKGVHVGISDRVTGGLAHGGDSHGNTAFSVGKSAVVGTEEYVKEHYKNTGVQETLHPAINNSLPRVDDMIVEDDHDLGSVDCSSNTTPMATGYGEAVSQGSCTACSNSYFWTTYLTDCTKDVVSITARDEL